MDNYGNDGNFGNDGNAEYYEKHMQPEQPQQQPEQQPKPKKTRRGRGIAMVLIGAILGSVIGGGAVALYTGSQDEQLSASQQAYIDEAVAEAAESTSSGVDAINSTGSGTVG